MKTTPIPRDQGDVLHEGNIHTKVKPVIAIRQLHPKRSTAESTLTNTHKQNQNYTQNHKQNYKQKITNRITLTNRINLKKHIKEKNDDYPEKI